MEQFDTELLNFFGQIYFLFFLIVFAYCYVFVVARPEIRKEVKEKTELGNEYDDL